MEWPIIIIIILILIFASYLLLKKMGGETGGELWTVSAGPNTMSGLRFINDKMTFPSGAVMTVDWKAMRVKMISKLVNTDQQFSVHRLDGMRFMVLPADLIYYAANHVGMLDEKMLGVWKDGSGETLTIGGAKSISDGGPYFEPPVVNVKFRNKNYPFFPSPEGSLVGPGMYESLKDMLGVTDSEQLGFISRIGWHGDEIALFIFDATRNKSFRFSRA